MQNGFEIGKPELTNFHFACNADHFQAKKPHEA